MAPRPVPAYYNVASYPAGAYRLYSVMGMCTSSDKLPMCLAT